MTKLFLLKTEGGDIIGWGPNDQAYLAKLGPGECLECDTRKARNPAHHRRFFALLQAAFAGQNKYQRIGDLLIELKLRAGWYDEYVTAEGKLVYVPKSISWARMDQETFEEFYGDAVVELSFMFPEIEHIAAEADEIIARRTLEAVE
ncbi:MAG TPA: DUF1367 family protein [Trueperaceae bacterium]